MNDKHPTPVEQEHCNCGQYIGHYKPPCPVHDTPTVEEQALAYAATGWKQLETHEPDFDQDKYNAYLAGHASRDKEVQELKEEMARKAQLASRDMQEYIWEFTALKERIRELEATANNQSLDAPYALNEIRKLLKNEH